METAAATVAPEEPELPVVDEEMTSGIDGFDMSFIDIDTNDVDATDAIT